MPVTMRKFRSPGNEKLEIAGVQSRPAALSEVHGKRPRHQRWTVWTV